MPWDMDPVLCFNQPSRWFWEHSHWSTAGFGAGRLNSQLGCCSWWWNFRYQLVKEKVEAGVGGLPHITHGRWAFSTHIFTMKMFKKIFFERIIQWTSIPFREELTQPPVSIWSWYQSDCPRALGCYQKGCGLEPKPPCSESHAFYTLPNNTTNKQILLLPPPFKFSMWIHLTSQKNNKLHMGLKYIKQNKNH